MANFESIKTTIDNNIISNGRQSITGSVLNQVLHEMVDETESALNGNSEVHVIVSLDYIMDSINGDIGSEISMTDADVKAILSGKLIASQSPSSGYILADEVYYEDHDLMGFLVFHYQEKEFKVVFDLTNKVYLGSQSYYKAIAQKDYVDGKLTELSAEVGGLSERVDALGEGGSEVFEAIYGTTTYAEIVAARNEGKVVICNHAEMVFYLGFLSNTVAYFMAHYQTISYVANCKASDNKWTYKTHNNNHSLENLENGNVKVTIANQSAEVATPQYVDNAIQQSGGGGGTPSGDPMHYMFEAVGATYNATDEDIPMVGIYGDSYVHKAKHWHLNELGDITNEEMRVIYAERYPTKTMRYIQEWFREASARTTLSSLTQVFSTQGNYICYKAQCETLLFTTDINGEIMLANLADGFYRADKLRKILGILNMSSATAIGATSCYCPMLEYVRFKGVKQSANLSLAPMLSNASILYMIENVSATGITITLHASAYDRALADAEIVAAMESKQVNLAKA